MDIITAIEIIEGVDGTEYHYDKVLEAYQTLVDMGVILHMQGSLQRTAQELMDAGYIV
jgi:hypothetical protein